MGEMQRAAFCSSCGQAAKEGAKFCGKCGAQMAPIPSSEAVCASCETKAEDPADRFCSACGSAMPPRTDRTCAKPGCGAVLGPDFKFCGACGAAAAKKEAPPVSDFDLPKPAPAPAPRPASAPRAVAAKGPASGGSKKGLLVAGIAVSAIGLGLLGMGLYNGLAATGFIGGWQSSPTTVADAKADVWDGINAKQAEEEAAMLKKIEEGGSAK